MRLLKYPVFSFVAAVGLGTGAWLAASGLPIPRAAAQPSDPVENLQQVLKSRTDFDEKPDVLNYRKEELLKAEQKLQTTGDLRLALALSEWQDAQKIMPKLRQIDWEVRNEIGKRLEKFVQTVVKDGDSTSRIAAANMLGEMGASIRALPLEDRHGFARGLTPSLVALMEQDDAAVRQAAALALGKINPDAKVAAKALEEMLHSKRVTDRQAASGVLPEMIRTIYQLKKKGRAQVGVEEFDEDVIHCAAAVVPVAGTCLKDGDPVVRRNGLEALALAATVLQDLIPGVGSALGFDPAKMPASGRLWTANEKEIVKLDQEILNAKEELFAPLVVAMKDEGGLMARCLTDKDLQVRKQSRQALELIGSARLRLRRLRDVIPTEQGAVPVPQREDFLFQALEPGLLVIAKRVTDPNKEVRAATVAFLETMEDAAAPAIPALLEALKDKSEFIRWPAVRTLGKIGPVQTELTVPAIAKLLNPKESPDVREAAANALRQFGPAAKDALPALIGMLNLGEADAQEAVIKAINSIGRGQTKEAIPALRKSLVSNSPTVRKLAAEALGRLGPSAAAALPDLRERLRQDNDSEVRQAVSDAILEITRPKH